MGTWDRSSDRESWNARRAHLRRRALRSFSVASATFLLLLVSTAAAADTHFRGFDKNCGLCQFLQVVLEVLSLVALLLCAPLLLVQLCLFPPSNPLRQCFHSHLCRAPPSQPPSA